MEINETKKADSKFSKRFLTGLSIAVVLVLIFVAGFTFGHLQLQKELAGSGQVSGTDQIPAYLSKDVNFKEFWQVWNYVKDNYVKSDVPESQLFYGAMSGILASLNDPYSVFFTPDISKKFDEELSGSFEGIGAEIGMKDDNLTVIAPLPDSPAAKAGLKAGDKILAIDGKDTTGIALDYAVSIIRGDKGTAVKLTVLTIGDAKPRDLSITRDMIKIESVKFSFKDATAAKADQTNTNSGVTMKPGGIAYVQLLYFNEDTLGDWNKMVQAVLKANPKGIILDLRNNPGGFLTTAIEVAGEWVDGKSVVLERLRSGDKIEHTANRQAHFADIPTVVLVNGGSASGSEIVAGALQDYKVATLVGETTFGKGSVQDLKKFSDGSSVKLTIAEWLTPLGRGINKLGIKPDVEVKMTKEDLDASKDPQMDKALEILRSK